MDIFFNFFAIAWGVSCLFVWLGIDFLIIVGLLRRFFSHFFFEEILRLIETETV